jgi:hypothetical protein
VIDQVIKNASCHDDKMEAYSNAARALEDKFYGIELNHVPRRYNEEATSSPKSCRGESPFPIHSIDQSETLGIDGVPRGLPLARSSVPKTHSIKKNRKSTLKNTSNPIAPKTPKSSPLTHRFGRRIKGKRTTKGSHEFPPSNHQEQGPENTPRKPPRECSEKHHQEQPRTTQQSLEEPNRIIYTYQGGSYKV